MSQATPTIDVKTFARILGLSLSSVYRLRHEGKLPQCDAGDLRWRRETVEQFIAARDRAAATAEEAPRLSHCSTRMEHVRNADRARLLIAESKMPNRRNTCGATLTGSGVA